MISFYDVDSDYVDYLRKFDSRVPYIQYGQHEKFVCGIVLKINGCDYFAPVSSKINKQQTAMYIKDKNGNVLSSIKFNYMIPAPYALVTPKDISAIRQTDAAYADLLQKEYEFCRANESIILQKAQKVYAIGCTPRHFLNGACCDFQLLELKSKEYLLAIMDEAFREYDERHARESETNKMSDTQSVGEAGDDVRAASP